MKLILVVTVLLVAKANAWFTGRNLETTAVADDRPIDESCLTLGEEGSCEFYNCFEQRLPCGRQFYMQRYGNHYCNRFQRYKELFTEAGQDFVTESQQCLTNRLLEYYVRDYVNCHELEHAAMDMIEPCYTESGFCHILEDNIDQMIAVFEIRDLFSGGAGKIWRQMLGLTRHCGSRVFTNFMRAANSHIQPIVNYITNLLRGEGVD